ncbi:uncharacterized protein LOC119570845 [Penaeus monodon]|uniref:uncharacterized protein LOC119570845 n=1 Tax=Penaeus monodon TaxID=6687 RepID=UPI0018A7A26A|nr:uncharacterized protein LOC119570845 [Penaeus monodon]
MGIWRSSMVKGGNVGIGGTGEAVGLGGSPMDKWKQQGGLGEQVEQWWIWGVFPTDKREAAGVVFGGTVERGGWRFFPLVKGKRRWIRGKKGKAGGMAVFPGIKWRQHGDSVEQGEAGCWRFPRIKWKQQWGSGETGGKQWGYGGPPGSSGSAVGIRWKGGKAGVAMAVFHGSSGSAVGFGWKGGSSGDMAFPPR